MKITAPFNGMVQVQTTIIFEITQNPTSDNEAQKLWKKFLQTTQRRSRQQKYPTISRYSPIFKNVTNPKDTASTLSKSTSTTKYQERLGNVETTTRKMAEDIAEIKTSLLVLAGKSQTSIKNEPREKDKKYRSDCLI